MTIKVWGRDESPAGTVQSLLLLAVFYQQDPTAAKSYCCFYWRAQLAVLQLRQCRRFDTDRK